MYLDLAPWPPHAGAFKSPLSSYLLAQSGLGVTWMHWKFSVQLAYDIWSRCYNPCTWGVIVYESPRNTTLCEWGPCGGEPGNFICKMSCLCIPLDLVWQCVLPGGAQMARAWLFGWLIWLSATLREIRQTPSEYQARYDASTSTTKPEYRCI